MIFGQLQCHERLEKEKEVTGLTIEWHLLVGVMISSNLFYSFIYTPNKRPKQKISNGLNGIPYNHKVLKCSGNFAIAAFRSISTR